MKGPKLLPTARVAKISNQTKKVSVNAADVQGEEIPPKRLENAKF